MIRREIELSANERVWVLISQVEHARLSGELTRQGREYFSHEVTEAVEHHDDGWATWEAAPKINPAVGGPYSFLEMPLEESLVIWDHSIAAAREIGPLAGFMVAGHFYGLLSESDHAAQPSAIAWLAAKRKSRTAWLDEWIRSNPENTVEEAKLAQEQLLVADLFSLWLCCDAPTTTADGHLLIESAMKHRLDRLFGQRRFTPVGFGRRHPTLENPREALAWVIAVDPYPFRDAPLSLSLMAEVVPVAKYANSEELEEASRRIELRWRLIPPASDHA